MRVCMTRVASIGSVRMFNVPLSWCLIQLSSMRNPETTVWISLFTHISVRNRSREQHRPTCSLKLVFVAAKKS